jgi:hypothetical protein
MGQAFEAGSVAVLGNVLYYLVPGGHTQVKVDTCDISDLRVGDLGSVRSNRKWNSFDLMSKVSRKNGASFNTNFRPAAVHLHQTLYCFWVDRADSGQVYMVSMDEAGTFSSSAFRVYARGAAGRSAVQVSSYLSATVARNGRVITLNWFDPSSTELRTLVLDPNDIDLGERRWIGTEGSPLTPSQYGLESVKASYYRISTAWFTQGNQGTFMIASFYSSDKHRVYFLLYPISKDGTPTQTGREHVFTIKNLSVTRGFTMSRDPAGQIHGICCQADNVVVSRSFNTFQEISEDASGNKPLAWDSETQLNGSRNESSKCPVIAFVAGNGAAGPISLPNTQGNAQTFQGVHTPQYSFAFFAAGNQNTTEAFDIQCEVARHGTSSIVLDYRTFAPTSEHSDNRLMSLIMDSFPFPDQNLGSSLPPNRRIIEYTYGASSATQLRAVESFESFFGVRAAFTTTKGLGPSVESEFKSGPVGSSEVSTTVTETDGYSVYTTPIAVGSESPTTYKIEAHGEYYGSTPSQLVETIVIFRDTNGNIVSGHEAPLFSVVNPRRGSATIRVSGQYGTYCYTPGDIRTYEQPRIDATMAALYGGLSKRDKQLFTPGYASGYIENVIIPNAQIISDDNRNYLEFTIGGSGHSASTLEEINREMETFGVSTRGSHYEGVSGGSELSIFGVGVGFSASLLTGVEFSSSTIRGVDRSRTWGIAFADNSPSTVSRGFSYTVKMYICKPSSLWARELQFLAPDLAARSRIDFEGSIPSKIMFVVSNIHRTREQS